jgi:hypothetical protein
MRIHWENTAKGLPLISRFTQQEEYGLGVKINKHVEVNATVDKMRKKVDQTHL